MIPAASTTSPDPEAILQSRLLAHSQLGTADIKARVRNGLACLKGYVTNGKQRRLASEIANQVEGVVGVVNMTEVMPSYLLDDERLTHRVASAISRSNRINDARISVRAVNGIVRLSGFVDTIAQKWLAENQARQSPDVADIVNSIVVAPRPRPRQDIQTLGEILLAFSHCLGLDLSEIAVDMREGVVTLEGAVPDDKSKSAAEELARRTPNVADVVNELAVRHEKP